jgi:acetolactate synthase-1/2/3 large subunit
VVDDQALANAYGAHGHRVDASGRLADLLRHAADTGGVHLIDVPVDYSENVSALFEDITSTTGNAVGR